MRNRLARRRITFIILILYWGNPTVRNFRGGGRSVGIIEAQLAPGIDGVTVRKYEEELEENLKELVGRLKGKKYRSQAVYIPKDEKSVRPLWDTHNRRQDSTDGNKEATGGNLRAGLCSMF